MEPLSGEKGAMAGEVGMEKGTFEIRNERFERSDLKGASSPVSIPILRSRPPCSEM